MQKEIYFTSESIHQKSTEMLKEVIDYRHRHANITLQPGSAALLVLDMQEYFLLPDSHAFIPSAPPIIPGLQSLVSIFSSHNRPVIFTRHLNTVEDAGMMSIWWKDLLQADSLGSGIISGLDTSHGVILNKNQYDAFHETLLKTLLQKKKIRQVIITGVMTHLCCETTARSAFIQGYVVFFVVDGTATYTESFHRGSLLSLSHGFAVPILVNEILGAFKDG